MKSSIVKTLATLAAGAATFAFTPAHALPGADPSLAARAPAGVEKAGCGPWGCAPGWGGGYGYRGYGGYGGYYRPYPPRPWGYGYGYGWRRPWGHRHYWGGGHGYGW